MNQSLEVGRFPDTFKEAYVTPLLKKPGLEAVFKNFRPISNLSFLSKVVERVVSKQIINHMQRNKLEVVCQSAYKVHHSTETALLKVHNDILLAMDQRRVTLLVLLDLSAAFDTVDVSLLLKRLETDFGICGKVLSWLSTYLIGRKQCVLINNIKSGVASVPCGVPQGSVLGPLLFSLYTSPLCSIINEFGLSFHLYADDTQLYVTFDPDNVQSVTSAYKRMSECIRKVKDWMYRNKLKLNSDKTEFMVIGREYDVGKVSQDTPEVEDVQIKASHSVRNLGSMFDSHFKMESHVNHICKTAFFQLKGISQIRKYLSQNATEKLVHALVTSRVDYCNSLLSGVSGNIVNFSVCRTWLPELY